MNRLSRILTFIALIFYSMLSQAQVVVMPSMFGVQHRRTVVPPTIQTQSIAMDDEGSTFTAAVSVSAATSTSISARGVCWSTSPNPTIANTVASNGSGNGTYNTNLTGAIVSATTYYVRGYATVGGTTYYGNEMKMLLFRSTGALQTFIVPTGITSARIKVLGGEGGNATYNGTTAGGRGAAMDGSFSLTPGETINVVVGQKGGDAAPNTQGKGGGGGGGTFVYRNTSSPMIVAGGGGGSWLNSISNLTGDHGQSGSSGTSGKWASNPVADGGSNGNGGPGFGGGGGAGWLSAGTCSVNSALAGQRNPWNGGDYGAAPYGKGGYGGGGSGANSAGAGGGYSGGGACGLYQYGSSGSGGGGGSINNGTAISSTTAANTGDGCAFFAW